MKPKCPDTAICCPLLVQGISTGREPLLLRYLEQVFKLVDTEAQFSHAGLEQLPQTVLLHQTHKDTKCLLLWHLGGEQGKEHTSRSTPPFTMTPEYSTIIEMRLLTCMRSRPTMKALPWQ